MNSDRDSDEIGIVEEGMESYVDVRDSALKILGKSIDSKVNPNYTSIFKTLCHYLRIYNSYGQSHNILYNALITGSAVTHALCKSMCMHDLSPKVSWDFNDVDIIVQDHESMINEPVDELFIALCAWARSADNQTDDPPKINYSGHNLYDHCNFDPNTKIKCVHNFRIDKLCINLIEVENPPCALISKFDLVINKVFFNGTKIEMVNSPAIYPVLISRKFVALENTYNHSTWAATLKRIEKYRERGFIIILNKTINIISPESDQKNPENTRVIEKYYRPKVIYEPI
jgi:hypothetical protein